MAHTVLIVDDSNFMRSKIRSILEDDGYEIVGEASDGQMAIELAMALKPDIITLDNILPDMYGTDILRTITSKGVSAYVIMISAVGQQSTIEDGKSLGAKDYIVKPFGHEELLKTIGKYSK